MDFRKIIDSSKFYELSGALFGDGHIKYSNRKYNCYYGITITGDLTEDMDYLLYLQVLINSLIDITPTLKIREKYGVAYLNLDSKEFVNFLVNDCVFPCNREKRTANIPHLIRNAKNLEYLGSFVRGLFDTDGTLFFGKKGCYSKYCYPMIELKNRNTALLEDTKVILEKLGFNPHIRNADQSARCLYLSGRMALENWMIQIGFSNPKHYTKYLLWKKFDECPPRTTLRGRYILLDNNQLKGRGVGRPAMHPTQSDSGAVVGEAADREKGVQFPHSAPAFF